MRPLARPSRPATILCNCLESCMNPRLGLFISFDVQDAFSSWPLSETFVHVNNHQHSQTDTLLFVYHMGSDVAYLLLYVDDIILTASSTALLQRIITLLHMEILEHAHMQHCNPCKTLVDTESKLGSDGDPISDPTLYRSLAGALQYLTFTRSNISYVVQQICLYMHDPRDPHFTALKSILRYVRGTVDHGLQLHVSSTSQLTTYKDVDWAGCPVTRRSTSGYCVFLGDNLLSWSAKWQVTLSRSSAEAKYRGVMIVVAETAWIRNLLLELHTPLSIATLVYCDNVSAVYLSTNPVQHQRQRFMKHIGHASPYRTIYVLVLKQIATYLLKEDVSTVPVWVKLHDVPVTAFSEDDLSGRSSYAKAIIELRANIELNDNIVVAKPKITRKGYYTCNVHVEYE
ncbi:ribonuclease H-like domain-containing protein [Tanacetum coccineum]